MLKASIQTSHFATCPLCEASCGLRVEVEGSRVLSVRGDEQDPLSRGYLCPKGVALAELHDDGDLLRRPLRKSGGGWREIGWEEALDEVARRLSDVQREYGRDAVATYIGTPTLHSYTAVLSSQLLLEVLHSRNLYTSNSVDALPRLLTSYLLYGSQALLPVPDLDRASHLLILGANPVVSNGSIMTSPGSKQRLAAITARGGRIVVIDPRFSETARIADAHHFIRPGTDALLLLALLHTIFAENLFRAERVQAFVAGIDHLRELVEPFGAEAVAGPTAIAATVIRSLARDFASADSAVCYGRMGVSTQSFGTLATWLIDCLNIVTGNLDRVGGAMFSTPAFDLAGLAAKLGQTGSFARYGSRVSGLPEFSGELPVAALAEEIETPGEGQVRALLVHAGNPVLAFPNGRRLERAFETLDFMVAIDFYLNETTRHADIILPPTLALEREHYSLVQYAMAVHNTARFSQACLESAPDSRHDWQIFVELSRRLLGCGAVGSRLASTLLRASSSLVQPRRLLALGLRFGPYGPGWKPWGSGVTLKKLLSQPEGIDLGPLQPRLPSILATPAKLIQVVPEPMIAELERIRRQWLGAAAKQAEASGVGAPLRLIGRRHLRSANSWLHNLARLQAGKPRCTLLIHPDDAAARQIHDGQRVQVRSRIGAIEVPAVLSRELMPGVVSLPHGWGHHREGTSLAVAGKAPGASFNDISDEKLIDQLSGCSDLNGVLVEVRGLADGPAPQD